MVGVDVSCLAANVSVNSFGVANSVAVASTMPSSKPWGLKPGRFDRLLPDSLPLHPKYSNSLLPSSTSAHGDSGGKNNRHATAALTTTASKSSSNDKKKGSLPASRLDLAAPCALLSEWIYDPSPSVSVLVNLLEEDVMVKVEETGQRLHIKAGGQVGLMRMRENNEHLYRLCLFIIVYLSMFFSRRLRLLLVLLLTQIFLQVAQTL